MSQSLALGVLFLSVTCAIRGVFGRPLSTEDLRDERLAILKRIIEDMKELIYVNDLYEEQKLGTQADLEDYLSTLSNTEKGANKRKVPGGFSAVRGKRPHGFSAVRGKRPHPFSAVRGKRDPRDQPYYIPDVGYDQAFEEFPADENKRSGTMTFSYVRGKKDLGENKIFEAEQFHSSADNGENDLPNLDEETGNDVTKVSTGNSKDLQEEKINGKYDYFGPNGH